jgi:hypothetical protein
VDIFSSKSMDLLAKEGRFELLIGLRRFSWRPSPYLKISGRRGNLNIFLTLTFLVLGNFGARLAKRDGGALSKPPGGVKLRP